MTVLASGGYAEYVMTTFMSKIVRAFFALTILFAAGSLALTVFSPAAYARDGAGHNGAGHDSAGHDAGHAGAGHGEGAGHR